MKRYTNASAALPDLMRELLRTTPIGSRNGATHELLMAQWQLALPLQREILVPARGASYPAQIAEAMWVLAGRNDITWLSAYLPRAAQFSDNGVTWRGGYGPRIRNHWGVDQLAHVVQLLKADPDTRRAVINIYDPAVDSQPGKDIPCNNWLHFIARRGTLHLNVATRSNDVMWGWSGVNAFEWSVLLQMVASMSRMDVGTITFNVTSLHLYTNHADKARRIVGSSGTGAGHLPRGPWSPATEVRTLAQLDGLLASWFLVEAKIRRGTATYEEITRFPDPLFSAWLAVLAMWWGYDRSVLHVVGQQNTPMEEALRLSPARKEES